jgi:hypothetical protein
MIFEEFFELYSHIEELESDVHFMEELAERTSRNLDIRIDKIKMELSEAKETYDRYYKKFKKEISETITPKFLDQFVNDCFKDLIHPRYGLQGIYEDYQKDDVDDLDNLELQRALSSYNKRIYDNNFWETFKNYKKILFINKIIGENK